MNQEFINYDLLKSFVVDSFTSKIPFPWYDFHQFLTPEGFQRLYQDFPCLELFEKHNEIPRNYGQRSHNRYYLAYKESIYNTSNESGKGTVQLHDLPKSWQAFIEELETSKSYKNFIQSLLEISDFKPRYAWHIGISGSEVSPHLDSKEKVGTHIFYFNTSLDWDSTWGGSTLVLGGKLTHAMNPDFSDFNTVTPVQIVDNHSFLFKNTPDAWHGVEALACTSGRYRRLFNVIFEFSGIDKQPKQSSPLSFVKKIGSVATGLRKTI